MKSVDFSTLKTEYSDRREIMEFEELEYIEELQKSRYQLLYKYPMIFFIGGTLYFMKKVKFVHEELFKK